LDATDECFRNPEFPGLDGYYCWFIKDFSKIAKPITWSLEKNKDFDWTKEC
jgi:hypothetical protein